MEYCFLLLIPVYFLVRIVLTKTKKPGWFAMGILQNQWLWFHMGCSLIASKILGHTFSGITSVGIIALISILWEIYEYYHGGPINYPSKKHWMWDSIGDVVMAMIMAIIYFI